MRTKLFIILAAALAAVAPVAGETGSAAAAVAAAKSPRALQVMDRAVRAAGQIREYSAEVESFYLRKADGESSPSVPSTGTLIYRAPAYLWVLSESDSGYRVAKVADGQTHYEFSSGNAPVIKKTYTSSFSGIGLKNYPDVELPPLSPFYSQVSMLADWRGDETVAIAYQGKELVNGVLCEAVQFTVPMNADSWKVARKKNRALPEKPGCSFYTYYFGVEDGLLRRQVSTTEIPGVSQSWSEDRYTVKKPYPNEDFSFARLEAAVKPWLGDKPFPEIENQHNEVGQPLPAVNAALENGRPLRWEDYRGKVLVVETWASWCTFCKKAMPFYEKMRKALAGQDVVFMALNFEEDQALYEKWMRENRGNYGFVYARAIVTEENWEEELKRFKGNKPAFYVVGRDGNVVAGYTGFGYGPGREDPRLLAALAKAGVKL